VWIGGTDMFAEGRWVWIETLRSISFNNWFTVSGGREPHGGVRENCMVWLHHHGFYWHDLSCSSKRKFVCQRLVLQLLYVKHHIYKTINKYYVPIVVTFSHCTQSLQNFI
jgi:hypothetical protein